jgi:putative ABC transport system permease protein
MLTVRLAWRMLLRDARAGELRLLAAALLIAVASVTSVGFFVDRIGRAMTRESHQLIGADLIVSADRPLPDAYAAAARDAGLSLATSAAFPSMVSLGDKAQLAGFKAVSPGYPLRGRLRAAPDRNMPDAPTREIPAPGTVWLDEQLAASLAARPGDLLSVGDAKLRFERVLTLEPDRGVSFFAIAPRLLMNQADLDATGLIQVGSRVTWRLLVAGDEARIGAFGAGLRGRLERGQWIEEVSNARPELRATVERAQQFLGLVALLAVILAAVSIALGARRFTQRHLDGCAVLRSMGSPQSRLLALFGIEFALLGLTASAAGTVLGFAVHEALARLLGYLVAAQLPAATPEPALQGLATGTLLLLGFAMPPLVRLAGVPPVRVIRREIGEPRPAALLAYGAGGLALFVLVLWQARDLKLGLVASAGFAVALGISALLTWGVVKLLARLRGEGGFSWRYGVAAMSRRSLATVTQVVALSLGLAALLMLTITRGDLVDQWQARVSPQAPNRFVINLQPEQRTAFATTFTEAGLPAPEVYPMVRGRLLAVNGVPMSPQAFNDDRARRLVDREFNLSYMTERPAHNRQGAGRWFDARDLREGALSVEEGIMKTLGLKLGDRLTYEVGGRRFEAPIVGVRKLDWDSMRANFFVIATPGLLDGMPQTFMTAFHLPAGQTAFTSQLVARMPNLTVVDVEALIRQVRSVIDQVVAAVQFIFVFTLAAGLTVLYAALTASQDERVRETGIMRALGATAAQLKRAQWTEFLLTGALAGLFASAIAFGVGAAVSEFVLRLPVTFNPWLWIAGIAAGATCAAAGGALALGGALKRPPVATLREFA